MNKKTDWSKLEPKQCEYCDNDMFHKIWEKGSQFKKRRFCSNDCKMKWIIGNNRGKKAYNNRQIKRICIWCGKEEMVSPAFSDRPHCSRDCMQKHYASGIMKEENHWNWQGGKWKRYCVVCGKEFEFDKGDFKGRKNSRLFCSQSCFAQSRIGDKNTNWKGGIQPERLKIRNSKEAREWKIVCLVRDNHTCQICSEIENLHVHHIKEFSKHPNLRFDTANGLTLCENCHYGLHYNNYNGS